MRLVPPEGGVILDSLTYSDSEKEQLRMLFPLLNTEEARQLWLGMPEEYKHVLINEKIALNKRLILNAVGRIDRLKRV